MKNVRSFILTCTILFLTTPCFALGGGDESNQTKPKKCKNKSDTAPVVLVYSFEDDKWRIIQEDMTKELGKILELKRGTQVYVQVKYRNPFLYNKSVNVSQSRIIYPNANETEEQNSSKAKSTPLNLVGMEHTDLISEIQDMIFKLNMLKMEKSLDTSTRASIIKLSEEIMKQEGEVLYQLQLTLEECKKDTCENLKKIQALSEGDQSLKNAINKVQQDYAYLKSIGESELINSFIVDNDFVEIDFKFSKKTIGGGEEIVPVPVNIQRKGFKISFSSGLAFSGPVYKDDYFVKQDTLRANFKNKVYPSLITLMHIHKLHSKPVTGGFSMGTGISLIENPLENIEFFLGGSLFWGPNTGKLRQRFVVSAGLKFSKVSIVKNGYEKDNLVPQDFSIEANIRDEYRPGWFVSFTYNLSPQNNQLTFTNDGAN